MTTEFFPSTLKLLFHSIDFIVVYGLVYRLLLWLKRSRSIGLLKGFLVLFFIFGFSFFFNLKTINWIFGEFSTILVLFVTIIFQPEIRRFIERIGVSKNFLLPFADHEKQISNVKKIMMGLDILAQQKLGALIVIECTSNLDEYVSSGIRLDSEISAELIASLFWHGSPTHDGAVILSDTKIVSAGCFLPLSSSQAIDSRLGTRHRAALGLSEISDAVIIVLSEETGYFSILENGIMHRYVSKEDIESRLFELQQRED